MKLESTVGGCFPNWLGNTLRQASNLFLVGGAVRDILMGRIPKDIDLTCRDAEKVAWQLARFQDITVVPMVKKPGQPCFRLVNRKEKSRSVDIAEMQGESIIEDLRVRDFAINAMAFELSENGQPVRLIDPLEGQKDIAGKLIRQTSAESFVSDPLRILRAFRFRAQLKFFLDPLTEQTIREMATSLGQISVERIVNEMRLILHAGSSSGVIREMDALGVWDFLFPETIPMKGCTQNSFHHKDVWNHSILVLENLESILNALPNICKDSHQAISRYLEINHRQPLLKLSALLHDIGKPATRAVNGKTGRITFYGHDHLGAEMVVTIAERLELSLHEREFLKLLVAEHLHVLSLSAPDVSPRTLNKWFRKCKEDIIAIILLGLADIKGTLGPDAIPEAIRYHIDWSVKTIRHFLETAQKQLERKNLISGRDLIALGVKPGPDMGRILSGVQEAQDDGIITDREGALRYAEKIFLQSSAVIRTHDYRLWGEIIPDG